SSGTLLVESSEVPDYVVRSTVPSLPDQQVRTITDRVLTDEHLSSIVAANHLYPELAGQDPKDAIRQLRQNLSVKAEDPKLLQDVIGADDKTVAFTITFTDGSPEKAQTIARKLVSLYLSENQRAQQELASSTRDFLAAQASRLEKQMAQKEKELAAFKGKHADSLPELQNMNMQLMDRAQQDIQNNASAIRDLTERVSLLQSTLATLSPYAPVFDANGKPLPSPADQLKTLHRQYVTESAVYSQDYPDLLRLKRQIEALSNQTGLPGIDKSVLQAELDAKTQELNEDRQHYGPAYPDVVQLERAVKNLRTALAKAPASSGNTLVVPPDNPAYIEKQVELKGTQVDLSAALKRRDDLNQHLKDLETRLTATPEVEREYKSLTRGYTQLTDQYADLQRKLREAEVSVNLEDAKKGQQFSVLRSPQLPSLPAKPNRIAILLLGLALALGAGAGGMAVAEVSDASVRSPRDVHRFLEIPPLVMIPYIDNDADIRNRRWRRAGVGVLVSGWLAVTALCIMIPAA
ncbi:MAG TPA: hypothetical protein VFY39_07240, partial [Gammaproteobacteria bacterium]|nr:hypothetical protein [Gammaproteobacteria bacterium]